MKKDFVINSMTRGYIQIYTGDGKGKTTAAIGLAVRAVGAGMKVYIGEFIKENEYSEINILRERFPEIDVEFYKEDDGNLISVPKKKENHNAEKNDSRSAREFIRSAGVGLKEHIGQFIKEAEFSEIKRLQELFPEINLELSRKGDSDPIIASKMKENCEAAKRGFDRVREVVMSGEYDLVILDELTLLLIMRIIKQKEIIKLMQEKPDSVELVITGRHASKQMIKNADLVSEMKEIKHYYNEGVLSRKGIEC